jgi:hypothetical protein
MSAFFRILSLAAFVLLFWANKWPPVNPNVAFLLIYGNPRDGCRRRLGRKEKAMSDPIPENEGVYELKADWNIKHELRLYSQAEYQELEALIGELEQVLQKVEWCAIRTSESEITGAIHHYYCCPTCRLDKQWGKHLPNCELWAALHVTDKAAKNG